MSWSRVWLMLGCVLSLGGAVDWSTSTQAEASDGSDYSARSYSPAAGHVTPLVAVDDEGRAYVGVRVRAPIESDLANFGACFPSFPGAGLGNRMVLPRDAGVLPPIIGWSVELLI